MVATALGAPTSVGTWVRRTSVRRLEDAARTVVEVIRNLRAGSTSVMGFAPLYPSYAGSPEGDATPAFPVRFLSKSR